MGFLGCVSSPETTPTTTSTLRPSAEPTPTSRSANKKFTEAKQCPKCSNYMYLEDKDGVLWWVCSEPAYCGYTEKVTEEEILRKYGYST
jgi:ssDNA-binding Zn-finger/Zn-ribbon topoisomerase 1